MNSRNQVAVREERGLNHICLYKLSFFHKTVEAIQKYNEKGITIKINCIKKYDNLTCDQAYDKFMEVIAV